MLKHTILAVFLIITFDLGFKTKAT